jgi:hypothetical protein
MTAKRQTKAEREAESRRIMANAACTRALAERGLAELEGREPRRLDFDTSTRAGREEFGRFVEENVRRTRALAEKGLAELERRKAS